MAFSTAAGTILAVSAATPATFDAAGYAALTYTVVGSVSNIGTFGANFAKVEFQPLNGGKLKLKGSIDYGTLSPTVALDPADAGQTLLRTAANDATQKFYSVKLTLQDGTVIYSQFICMGLPYNVGDADSVNTATPSLELQKPTVVVAGS